jgi:hypothetical protein
VARICRRFHYVSEARPEKVDLGSKIEMGRYSEGMFVSFLYINSCGKDEQKTLFSGSKAKKE